MNHMSRAVVSVTAMALVLTTRVSSADVVAVVSVKSTVMALSKDQLTGIFFGKLSHFPDGLLAVPIDQAENSDSRSAFYVKLADKSQAQLKAYWSKIIFTGRGKPPMTVADGIEVKRSLTANPAAIGYIDAKLVDNSVRVLF